MIDPKNMNTWPVVFIEQGDVEAIRALDGFTCNFDRDFLLPHRYFGSNKNALVVYIIATVENLQKQLATSEATVKETLKIKQQLFEEAQGLRIINANMANEALKAKAPSSELEKENWKLHNEAIVLKDQVKNLERQKKCMTENFMNQLAEKNLAHENDIKNLNNTIIRLRSEDGNHLAQSLQKDIKRLKDKIAEYQNDGREMGLEVSNLRQEVANLRHRNKVLEASIGSREREIDRLKPFEGSYDRWQLENRILQEKLENIKKSLSGLLGRCE